MERTGEGAAFADAIDIICMGEDGLQHFGMSIEAGCSQHGAVDLSVVA